MEKIDIFQILRAEAMKNISEIREIQKNIEEQIQNINRIDNKIAIANLHALNRAILLKLEILRDIILAIEKETQYAKQ